MSYNHFTHEVVSALGIPRLRLPVQGMSPRFVLGVLVWVNPLPPREPDARGKRSTHRLLCACPECGKHLSLGRLPQHQKIHGAK